MKAADYVLVPDIVNRNANSGGKNIGGMLGGMMGGVAGALLGGISLKSKTADVVLTLTDVRSTEQVSLQQGHAKKTDLGWGAGGGAFFGGFAAGGASSYANTEIGQVVTAAYLDAFVKLVDDVKQIQPDAKANNVQQAVTMAKPGKLFDKAGRQVQGRARPGRRHDAVSHRREAGPVLGRCRTNWAMRAGCRQADPAGEVISCRMVGCMRFPSGV